jgi:3-deoxy-7-phosphoheptulonate synthase
MAVLSSKSSTGLLEPANNQAGGHEFLSHRVSKKNDTIVQVGNSPIGSYDVQVAAGPCSIDFEGLADFAVELKKAGANIIRGGAFKPRTSPYSFLGYGEKGLKDLLEAKEATGIPIVSEIMDSSQLPLFADVDMLQVGSRNAQNFTLLSKLGEIDKPVLLKRGMGNTLNELLGSAEYIMKGGNSSVVLCERGIRTFEDATRFTMDIGAVPVLKRESHLPVCVDPSHAAGQQDLVIPLALAAVAAGANMLLIEVHPDPKSAMSDSSQQLTLDQFKSLMRRIRKLEKAMRH